MMWTFKFPLVLFSILLTISQILAKDLNYTIPEEEKPNYSIGNIREDFNLSSYFIPANIGEYEKLKYSILSQGNPHASFFTIDEGSSALYTRQKLDREALEHCEFSTICELSIDVIAKASVGTFFKKIKVKIFLSDINDNEPTFSVNTTNLEVSESYVIGSSIPIDGAVDRDSGINSVQSYRIQEQTVPFLVEFNKYVDGSSSVKIIVNQKLDSETKNFYQLHVLAVDGGSPPKTGVLLVNITVLDVNDNAPIFTHSMYNVTVREDTRVNTTIVTVAATDKDSGQNGKIRYRLSPHQPDIIHTIFAMDAITGALSIIKTLIYEPGERYHVIVEASDMASKPLFTQATVYVNVNDSSNNPPQININLLSNADVAKISENANIGAAVAHIGVTDDDIGKNGIVSCHLKSYFFVLEPLNVNEYKVVVNQPLNRESLQQHTVIVQCQDKGIPPFNTTESFVVKVLDENDHAPKFSKLLYVSEITENNQLGARLIQVSAIDFDIGINSEVEYSINNSSPYNFSIDGATGVIYVDSYLDREAKSEVSFQVKARDKGKVPQWGSSTVRVTILDVNDNTPKFTETVYMFNVTENSGDSLFVGQVDATDADKGENGTVKFKLSPENIQNLPFSVLPNGSIFTTQSLNRETQPHGYNFNIFAFDQGTPPLNSVAHVMVFVEDENDNRPVIFFPVYDNRTVRMYYNNPVDISVTRVIAYDPDMGGNSKLTYSIVQIDEGNIFTIDSNTGEIYLKRPLTVDHIKTYTFTVKVEDHGIPQKSAEEDFVIIVTTPSVPPNEGEDQNLLIAIVISCVTIVLSVAIILVICIIRKKDKNKKNNNNKETRAKIAIVNGVPSSDMYDGIDRNMDQSRQSRAEKKVSFYMDSDPMTIIAASESRSPYPPATLGVEEILDRIMPKTSLTDMTPRAADNGDEYIQLQSTSMSHLPSSQHPSLPTAASLKQHEEYIQARDKQWSAQNTEGMHQNIFKKQDDNHSESSGETSTSDSGRGGSESDIQSSGGLSHCLELDILKNRYSPGSSPGKLQQINTTDKKIKMKDFRGNSHNSHNKHPLHSIQSHPPRTLQFINNNNNTISHHGPTHTDYKGRPSVHWRGVPDILNSSMATIEDYDEDDTTTSGSYTVDEEDLRSEMTGMDCFV